jgi:hypothetical protein
MASQNEILNSVYDSTNQQLKVGGGTGTSTNATIGDGLKLVTTAGTREALAASTACKSVCITARSTNTGTVVVGGTTVVAASGATRRGTPLSPGDSVSIDIDNLNDVNVDVTVNGEGVVYTYVV